MFLGSKSSLKKQTIKKMLQSTPGSRHTSEAEGTQPQQSQPPQQPQQWPQTADEATQEFFQTLLKTLSDNKEPPCAKL
jgi:hypothetical protein